MYNISLREGTWRRVFGVPLLGLKGVLLGYFILGMCLSVSKKESGVCLGSPLLLSCPPGSPVVARLGGSSRLLLGCLRLARCLLPSLFALFGVCYVFCFLGSRFALCLFRLCSSVLVPCCGGRGLVSWLLFLRHWLLLRVVCSCSCCCGCVACRSVFGVCDGRGWCW
jgi:hypothetical protein